MVGRKTKWTKYIRQNSNGITFSKPNFSKRAWVKLVYYASLFGLNFAELAS